MPIWLLSLVAVLGTVAASSTATTRAQSDVIAFSRWNNGRAQIYLVDADGTGLRRLTETGPWEDSHPAWSPDRRHIVFGRRDAKGWRLYVTGLNGGVRALTTTADPLASHPTWSPDGRRIVFERLAADLPETGCWPQQLYVVGQDGRGLRQLTTFVRFKGGAGGAHWASKGSRVVFWGEERPPADELHPDAYTMRADGSGLHRLIPNAADPALSPDGRKIAFARGGEIYVASADGRGVRRLTRTRFFDSEPIWSPDGRRIAFSSMHRWKVEISVVGADGRGLREITNGGTDVESSAASTSPAWMP